MVLLGVLIYCEKQLWGERGTYLRRFPKEGAVFQTVLAVVYYLGYDERGTLYLAGSGSAFRRRSIHWK
jgi:hypothetical protein